MSELFTLYRYLVQNRDADENPYNDTLRALEAFLNILTELESWGKNIANYGSLDWDEALVVTDKIVQGHKAALCARHNNDAVAAVVNFAASHVSLGEYEALILALTKQKELEEKAYKEAEEALGDLDDHPF